MGQEQRRLHLAYYWAYYYDELRKQLLNYTTDPESVPHHLRGHERRIQTWECQNGYVILHYADPENIHKASTPERFELVIDSQNETLGELIKEEIPKENVPSGLPVWVTHLPYIRNETRGEYETLRPWERRDLITNRRIDQWSAERWKAQTAEDAITQAQEDLRDFFNLPSTTT